MQNASTSAMDLAAELKAGEELASSGALEAAALKLKNLLLANSINDVEAVKTKETAVTKICDVLVKKKDAVALRELLGQLREFFTVIPKAKTAK